MSSPRHAQVTFAGLIAGLALSLAGCQPPCLAPVEPVAGESFDIDGFGTITILGTLGGWAVEATAVNNAGQVTGTGGTACPVQARALLWQDSELQELGTLGGRQSWGEDINATGQIVGWATTGRIQSILPVVGWPLIDEESLAFVWDAGVVTNLGALPGGLDSGAVAINDVGQIVGWAELPFDAVESPVAKWRARALSIAAPPRFPVLWQPVEEGWELTRLPALGGLYAEATDINNSGRAVGWARDAEGRWPAVVWQDGQIAELPTLGGELSQAVAINDAGQIVGWSVRGEPALVDGRTTGDPKGGLQQNRPMSGIAFVLTHAVLWLDGQIIDLGTLGGEGSEALAINNLGWIVGSSATVEGSPTRPIWRGFLWRDGQMLDLNDLLPADSEWVIETASAINDAGQIIAEASRLVEFSDGTGRVDRHSVVITLAP